jgi:hypothetical protein
MGTPESGDGVACSGTVSCSCEAPSAASGYRPQGLGQYWRVGTGGDLSFG